MMIRAITEALSGNDDAVVEVIAKALAECMGADEPDDEDRHWARNIILVRLREAQYLP